MNLDEWRDNLIKDAINQIKYKSNMSAKDINELTDVLKYYLSEGIQILKKWRKIKEDAEFTSGEYDFALINFIKNKNLVNGRDIFQSYNSGGVSSGMQVSPEDVLKSEFPQRMA